MESVLLNPNESYSSSNLVSTEVNHSQGGGLGDGELFTMFLFCYVMLS